MKRAYLALGILSLFLLFPFVWMVLTSLKDANQVARIIFLPTDPTLDNYLLILTSKQSPFLVWLVNSLIVTSISVVSVLLLDSLMGYALSKFRFPGRQAVFLLVLATLMIPTEMLVIPWYSMAVMFKVSNSFLGLAFPGLVSAFGVFLMRQFLQAVPDDFLEAARIDGMGELGIFFRVVLPLAAPALATLATFTVIGSWNAFLWPLVVTSKPAFYVLPVGLANFASEAGSDWQLVMAGATLATLPLLIAFLIFQKRIADDLSQAGLKG